MSLVIISILTTILKVLLIAGLIVLAAAPFLIEYSIFLQDKKKKLTHRRLGVLITSAAYAAVATAVIAAIQGVISLAVSSLTHRIGMFALIYQLFLTGRVEYSLKILAVLGLNFLVGFGFLLFCRIGMRKKTKKERSGKGKKKIWLRLLGHLKPVGDGTETTPSEYELSGLLKKTIRYFHTEAWMCIGRVIGRVSAILSLIYAAALAVFLIPVMFAVPGLYGAISIVFDAMYWYPAIPLLILWEFHYFLAGIQLAKKECPELRLDGKLERRVKNFDAAKVARDCRGEENAFADFYVCDVKIENRDGVFTAAGRHCDITERIAAALESDGRNPQAPKEIYMRCLDNIVESEHNIIVNGSFFSEFSMYFLRYLSLIVARGDNVILVCGNDEQADSVEDFVRRGFGEISSLYTEFSGYGFDDPVWRIKKIHGTPGRREETLHPSCSILVTTMQYLASDRFLNGHREFIQLLDSVIFVDTLATLNTARKQMAFFNTALEHIAKLNAQNAMNRGKDDVAHYYTYRKVKYICFDETAGAGMDKTLAQLLSAEFTSTDAARNSENTLVCCYNLDGNGDGVDPRIFSHYFETTDREEIGVIINMAAFCAQKNDVSRVAVFVGDAIPHANYLESIRAHGGTHKEPFEKKCGINKYSYNPDDYSVIIAADLKNDLPAAIRKYAALAPEEPSLILMCSRPYLFRDYYMANIDALRRGEHVEKIPSFSDEGKSSHERSRDLAISVLVRAGVGGVSVGEMFELLKREEIFAGCISKRDLFEVLRLLLAFCGIEAETAELIDYFEITAVREFNEKGEYVSGDRVCLKEPGKIFDAINAREMITLLIGSDAKALPLPKCRLTQNYISGQCFIYGGKIYRIIAIDPDKGIVRAEIPSEGTNSQPVSYLQDREYRIDCSNPFADIVEPRPVTVTLSCDGGVPITYQRVSVFRAPVEVVTHGYYEIEPHYLTVDYRNLKHIPIDVPGGDSLAKQTYRRYGTFEFPTAYAEADVPEFSVKENGARIMSIELRCELGESADKTALLASVMLGEILRSMFPSVADSIAVCPILRATYEDEDSRRVLAMQPRVTLLGRSERFPDDVFQLLIIEDSESDLGVISALKDETLIKLFTPINEYLAWYRAEGEKSRYLYYGLDHEPSCFDFESLYKLSKPFCAKKPHVVSIAYDPVLDPNICPYCAKSLGDYVHVIDADKGIYMCADCFVDRVGNKKRILRRRLNNAINFFESTYSVNISDKYTFRFESGKKIARALEDDSIPKLRRDPDGIYRTYIDDQKCVHIDYSLPARNISELIIRQLTYIWQLENMPSLPERIAEGHIALVGIQYLRYLRERDLAEYRNCCFRGFDGYSEIAGKLRAEPRYRNNPFLYLIRTGGGSAETVVELPFSIVSTGDFGEPYIPSAPDRHIGEPVPYFYYDRLSSSSKTVYDKLCEAIAAREDTVAVGACIKEDFDAAVNAIRYERPEFFYFNTAELAGETAIVYYGASADEIREIQAKIDAKVPEFLEGIDDSMSAYDVAIRLHAKVIGAVDYDTIMLNEEKVAGGPFIDRIDYLRSICGVFLDRRAVCAGYAKAMNYLLHLCGVESASAVGMIKGGGLHAWNIIKIDGAYYYIDATWDDSSDTIQVVKNTELSYNYFNVTTREISRSRDCSYCPVLMPVCDETRANYYTHNDLVITEYDLTKIKKIALAAAASEKNGKVFTFKCADESVYLETLKKLCLSDKDCFTVIEYAAKRSENKKIRTDTYSYSSNDKLYTITVYFKLAG